MLGNCEVNLQEPEEDKANGKHAERGARQADGWHAGKEVSIQYEFECCDANDRDSTCDQWKSEPVIIERPPKFAVQEVIDRAGRAAKDAGQASDGSA